MCLSCGCNEPSNDHGDERHITSARLLNAATAAGISPKRAAKNIRAALKAEKVAKPTAARFRVTTLED
jgi:hypothetical protein